MINRITLLLFIGLAWGQLTVTSKYDLEPFSIKNISSGGGVQTNVQWVNGKMVTEKETLEPDTFLIAIFGSYECITNEDFECLLLISYSSRNTTMERKKLKSGEKRKLDQMFSDTFFDGFFNENKTNKHKQLIAVFPNSLVEGMKEIIEYSFRKNDTMVEYNLNPMDTDLSGTITKVKDGIITLKSNLGDSIIISEPKKFLEKIILWSEQEPKSM
tara:strand:+ start:3460 stop:4104 length:645 start_codon:yes stop_codon:yes gene_type:complete